MTNLLKAPKRTYSKKELNMEVQQISQSLEAITDDQANTLFESFVERNALFVKSLFITDFHVIPCELTPGEKQLFHVGRKAMYQHIVWCCDQAIELAETGAPVDKVYRWLGFVQGCAWFTQCASIEQLIDSKWDYSQKCVPLTNDEHNKLFRGLSYVSARLIHHAASNYPESKARELSATEKKVLGINRETRVMHLLWCCAEIHGMLTNHSNVAKAHQWLGFVQGNSWMLQLASITSLSASIKAKALEPEND